MSGKKLPVGLMLAGMWISAFVLVGGFLLLRPILNPPEMPGDIPSPTLADLLNESVDAALKKMGPGDSPGLRPEAVANARTFLGEVREVVVRCQKGSWSSGDKYNPVKYDLLFMDGRKLEGAATGSRCSSEPLILRATFQDGRVVQATTDGRERAWPVDRARNHVAEFGERVIRVDWDLHPARYFPAREPEPTKEDIAKQWK
ncbi:hypothetical protein OV208_00605 [Corallococcus sp. bb12-1]|uniref:hypothetical protein n=1 Tax=Corallococcus sp. bb12-1 TaxID=2996784 RepID=UPI002270BC8D|nr:hypothetical protein [Corallococcus sp. bb12-1]MCY1039799.1 hypothetical protein [Corallococcus sp. bb12-1]